MNEGIITRRKKRTLTGDREDSAAKRTRTGNIECLNEEKAGTGSEPLTRQRKKAMEVVTRDDIKEATTSTRRQRKLLYTTMAEFPVDDSDVMACASGEVERNEQSARQRRTRVTATETASEDNEDQQAVDERSTGRDKVSRMAEESVAMETEDLTTLEHPKRQRRKTMKGLELESMLRRSSTQNSVSMNTDNYSPSIESIDKVEEAPTKRRILQSQWSHTSSDSIAIEEERDDSVNTDLWRVFQCVMECQTRDGRLVSEPFLKLPSRKEYPDYYEVITTPLSLNKIKERIKSGYYETATNLCDDLGLVFTNAHTYNEPNSQIYRDATKLMQVVKKKNLELCGDEEKLPASVSMSEEQPSDATCYFLGVGQSQDTDTSEVEEESAEQSLTKCLTSLYKTVLEHRDSNDRQLCELFLSLPSSEEYPDYFEMIKQPIDMSMIKDKIEREQYATEAHCVADFELMFSNARVYNEEGSLVYEDAIILTRLVKQWLKSRQRSDQTDSSTNQDELLHEGTIRRFCLGDVHYMLASEVSMYLGMMGGELQKHYPNISKKLASYEEKRHLAAQGFSLRPGQVSLLLADDVEQIIMQEEARKQILSADHDVEVPTVSENVSWHLRFLPEQLLLHLAFPSQQIVSATSVDSMNKERVKLSNVTLQKLYCLVETLKACHDRNGRQVAALFIELPSRHEYPDYYQVIRKPIDIKRIEGRIRCQQYCTMDDLFSDILLMCDNACRYNELGSEVFIDSQTLLQLAFRTRAELTGASRLDIYPRVADELQRLIRSLLLSVTRFKSDTGRRLADSLIPCCGDPSSVVWSLEDIIWTAERDGYRLLDEFQGDLLAILTSTRNKYMIDSERVYMSERDRLCGGVLKWSSPALNYQLVQFEKELTDERQKKLEESRISEEATKQQKTEEDTQAEAVVIQSLTDCCVDGVTCHVGDTVLVTLDGQDMELLFYIQKIWRDDHLSFEGHRFYFPHEIVLQAERNFLDREVLLSHESESVSVRTVQKICVMTDKQYLTHQPKDFPSSLVYFCESTYSKLTYTIRAFKAWPSELPPSVVLEERPSPFFCERRAVSHTTDPSNPRKARTCGRVLNNVVHSDVGGDDGQVYYEQFYVNNMSYKTGDCVYVNTDKHHPFVARIDKIWTDTNGDPWFRGPWFVHPFETDHLPSRTFFIHELLLSSVHDTNPLHSVVGRCAVLVLKDYINCRPVGVAERDVYVCEARYNEADKQIRKLKGLKKFGHSIQVAADEFYYFDEDILPLRIPSPFLFRDLQTLFGLPAQSQPSAITGFVHFANEMLPVFRQTQPSLSFPELLQRTAQQWDGLDDVVKHNYNEKSSYMMEAVELEETDESDNDEFECQWAGCHKSFYEPADFVAHILSTATDSHVILAKTGSSDYPCLWDGCFRVKRPFNQLSKIVRHIRDVHLKSMDLPESLLMSELYSSSGSHIVSQSTGTASTASQSALSDNGPVGRFVTPPQQQIQHSNVYLKYVEQLRTGRQKSSMNVCRREVEPILPDKQLELQFLGAGRGSHSSVIDAVWALRDAMMLDTLKLSNQLNA
ncbi:protein polybromo-1-like isoform X2 [Corticium candelabrum]|uniref:protein polybromo-1-like isoform X2 n=1 Tax=Corticium candelabrum TaxID=121492 RepID=UPI002E269473|nr:protein polybromo-1-like isoform X2 [Corticium candelabrum]